MMSNVKLGESRLVSICDVVQTLGVKYECRTQLILSFRAVQVVELTGLKVSVI